ncbi:bacterio-opsin activator domain-containing protein [Natrononativus amylolyticus]|uniref:bacterio-opsin activator domain-containing protein n=1 Tax=Natrononativus amylolyticus TaxID=2963434 RepID=UPI0020CBF453|nr:helix-turn-helix domain-containing protein [Natrononativus amylolyticus]
MATIVEFSIPVEEFALTETLERLPEMVFRIDRVVAHDTDHLMPFVWASRGDFDVLTRVLEDDSTVTSIDHLTTINEERLYRMEWTDKAHILGYMVIEHGATVQRATAHDDQWDLRVLFPEQSEISATAQYARDNGYRLDVTRVYDVSNIQKVWFDLTEDQHEALVAAVEHGYFNIPRDIAQEDLSEHLGISHQATSERLRRAFKGLAENVVHSTADEYASGEK